MPGKKISAKEILTDIRAGLDDSALREKYQLTGEGLESVFQKLLAAGALKQPELDQWRASIEDDVNLRWDCPACGTAQAEDFSECPECGVIVEKYVIQQEKKEREAAQKKADEERRKFEEQWRKAEEQRKRDHKLRRKTEKYEARVVRVTKNGESKAPSEVLSENLGSERSAAPDRIGNGAAQCIACMKDVPTGAKFCPHCGNAVSAEADAALLLECPVCGLGYVGDLDGCPRCRLTALENQEPAAGKLSDCTEPRAKATVQQMARLPHSPRQRSWKENNTMVVLLLLLLTPVGLYAVVTAPNRSLREKVIGGVGGAVWGFIFFTVLTGAFMNPHSQYASSSQRGPFGDVYGQAPCHITMSQYLQLSPEMGLREIMRIMNDCAPTELSRNEIAGFKNVMYMWSNGDGSNMNIMMQNGELVSKAQFGLR